MNTASQKIDISPYMNEEICIVDSPKHQDLGQWLSSFIIGHSKP